jgi:Transposase zinc-binding domain
MSAIERCRTAALGGHLEQCDSCGHQRPAYNSCRDRHCPKCQSLARARWLEERQTELLPVEYFHVVFTLPREIAAIAYENKEVVYGILFCARRAAGIRWSCRFRSNSEQRVPSPKRIVQLVIQDLAPRLQKQVCPTQCPVHLLLFDKAPTHNLVDRGFDKRRADRFPLPVPLTVVGDRFLIVANLNDELSHTRRQLFRCSGVIPNQIQVHEQVVQPLQGLFHVPMPQQVLDALQVF